MNVKFISETSLIEECIKKNDDAQKELYGKYARKLYAICNRYSNNYQVAEDILQDSFIRIFDNLKSFRLQGSFEGWMKRITINTALESLKKKKIISVSIDGDTSCPEIACEENIFSNLSSKDIIAVIQQIPEGYREVLNLFTIDGYTHKEIAKMLGISEANSKLRLNRARNMLKEKLTQLNTVSHECIS
ncbi:MAG: sigma-70 family RNA polymerase sigma factor [Bacteroidota bacterium]